MSGTIKIISGADYQDTITIYAADGVTPENLTNGEVRFKIAKVSGITNATATFYVTTVSATYLTITDAVSGVCTLDIPASITKGFAQGAYRWQIRYKASDA